MKNMLELKGSDFRELVSETARDMGVQPVIIEKDVWVCTVLERLFSDSLFKDHLVFKGGTSLSKVYKLINRFSEDIDLILDWRLFGYGTGEKDPYYLRSSKSKQDRFNKEIVLASADYVEKIFVPHIAHVLSDIHDIQVQISNSDPNAVEIFYPSAYSVEYVPNRVLLEIGPLAAWVPSRWEQITPYVSKFFPKAVGNIRIDVRSTTAERTFWEKATILHQEAHRTTSPPIRYSRHFYDLYKMSLHSVKESALNDPELLQQVVSFKSKFYPSAWARYDLAVPGTFKLISDNMNLKELERDYKEMMIMIFGDVPKWNSLVHRLGQLEEEINA